MFKHPSLRNPDVDHIVVRPTVDTGPGLTKQSFKDESNINFIMKKYQKTGTVNFVANTQPEFMEIPAIDFMSAMNTVIRANEMFGDMPSSLRKRFNNDPAEYLAFMEDPSNLDEMVKLGLAKYPEPVEPAEGSTGTVDPDAGNPAP